MFVSSFGDPSGAGGIFGETADSESARSEADRNRSAGQSPAASENNVSDEAENADNSDNDNASAENSEYQDEYSDSYAGGYADDYDSSYAQEQTDTEIIDRNAIRNARN